MMRIVGGMIAVLSILAIAWTASPVVERAGYTQTSCTSNEGYVIIGMTKFADLGTARAREYQIQFDEKGPLLRFPPEYYARHWDGIEAIAYESKNGGDSGVLKLHVRDPSKLAATDTIGIVKRSCWITLKEFIRTHVVPEGYAVRTIDR